MGGSTPTLVVGRAARAPKAHVAQVCSMSMSVTGGHAARHGHGPVAVCARHGAVGGGLVSEVGRGAVGDARGIGVQGRGGRIQLVSERVLLEWWG